MGKVTHGKSRTREYKCYHTMMYRCYDPNHRSYKYYGGREDSPIKVCERWQDINNFLADAVLLPGYVDGLKGLTLDRKDTNGDYSPENCKWSDALTQQNNKRNNAIVSWQGEKMTLAELARREGIEYKRMVSCYEWNKEKRDIEYIASRAKRKKEVNLADVARREDVPYAKLYHQHVTNGRTIEESLSIIRGS